MTSIFQNELVFISCQEVLAKPRFKSRNRKQSLIVVGRKWAEFVVALVVAAIYGYRNVSVQFNTAIQSGISNSCVQAKQAGTGWHRVLNTCGVVTFWTQRTLQDSSLPQQQSLGSSNIEEDEHWAESKPISVFYPWRSVIHYFKPLTCPI